MIEILLQAERALSLGMIDQAERMYRQAADADPRNSIAVVGLARVALERGDEPAAWRFAQAALVIDGENVAAQRLARRLEEVWAYRGASLPDVALAQVAARPRADAAVSDADVDAAESDAEAGPEPDPGPDGPEPDRAEPPDEAPTPAPAAPPHLGVVDRLFRRNRA